MSVAEIKAAIERLGPAECAEVSLFLRRRMSGDDAARRAELTGIRDAMEGGKVVSLDEIKRRQADRESSPGE